MVRAICGGRENMIGGIQWLIVGAGLNLRHLAEIRLSHPQASKCECT
jgi:hypothetical protein